MSFTRLAAMLLAGSVCGAVLSTPAFADPGPETDAGWRDPFPNSGQRDPHHALPGPRQRTPHTPSRPEARDPHATALGARDPHAASQPQDRDPHATVPGARGLRPGRDAAAQPAPHQIRPRKQEARPGKRTRLDEQAARPGTGDARPRTRGDSVRKHEGHPGQARETGRAEQDQESGRAHETQPTGESTRANEARPESESARANGARPKGESGRAGASERARGGAKKAVATCTYEATGGTTVMAEPRKSSTALDRLRPHDRTLGACAQHQQQSRWTKVVSPRQAKIGYAPTRRLKSLGPAKWLNL